MTTRTRKEPSKNEIEIRGNAVDSSIRRDFLNSNITYVDSKEMPFFVGKVRQTDETKSAIRNKLLTEFEASMVPVGNGKIAIVKRNPL